MATKFSTAMATASHRLCYSCTLRLRRFSNSRVHKCYEQDLFEATIRPDRVSFNHPARSMQIHAHLTIRPDQCSFNNLSDQYPFNHPADNDSFIHPADQNPLNHPAGQNQFNINICVTSRQFDQQRHKLKYYKDPKNILLLFRQGRTNKLFDFTLV